LPQVFCLTIDRNGPKGRLDIYHWKLDTADFPKNDGVECIFSLPRKYISEEGTSKKALHLSSQLAAAPQTASPIATVAATIALLVRPWAQSGF